MPRAHFALLAALLIRTVACFHEVAHSDTPVYDYVVVGSGAGGGTLAAALARKGHSVFLLEAGGDEGDNLVQQIPVLSATADEDPTMAWTFYVEHYSNRTQALRDSKYTYRLPNGTLYYGFKPPEGAEPLGIVYPRGACLGGSTAINAMGFHKPRNIDWDYFADLTRDKSWSAISMEKYWRSVERNLYLPRGTPGHGFDGIINSNLNNISLVTDRPGVVDVLANVANKLEGINISTSEQVSELMHRDINGRRSYMQGLYSQVLSTTENRRRSGARNFLVDTANAMANDGSKAYQLNISTHSLATRILFSDKTKESRPTAHGVEYLQGQALYGADPRYNSSQEGLKKQVFASKEVIISGGAFNTPQILKLSGIGPEAELRHHGIEVKMNLPAVGKYLQDHVEGIVTVNASRPWPNAPLSRCALTLDASDPCFQEWQSQGVGPYGDGGAGGTFAVLHRSNHSTTEEADLFWFAVPGIEIRGFYPGFSRAFPVPSSWSWDMIKMHMPGDGDHARGTVTLRSSNPREGPLINFEWLQGEVGERDLAAFEDSARVAYDSLDHAPTPYTPMMRVQPAEDVDLRQSIKDEAFGHHASSTCRMGPYGASSDYCVDPQLRVHGVDRLRVVDASNFPHTPGAFPATAVYMLALKAADMISPSE